MYKQRKIDSFHLPEDHMKYRNGLSLDNLSWRLFRYCMRVHTFYDGSALALLACLIFASLSLSMVVLVISQTEIHLFICLPDIGKGNAIFRFKTCASKTYLFLTSLRLVPGYRIRSLNNVINWWRMFFGFSLYHSVCAFFSSRQSLSSFSFYILEVRV